MYFDSYITGKRIQQLRKTKGLTQEQFAIKLNSLIDELDASA